MNLNGKENMSTPHINSNQFITSFDVSSNWEVVGNTKKLSNSISIGLAADCLDGISLEDIADEKTCITIKQKANDSEPCTVEIKLKNRGTKIKRVGIVSEASVLEIFQEFGEYTTTVFTEMIDEFEDSVVTYADVVFERPSSEVSIKFTRIKNNKSKMFLYGIRLLLQQSEVSNVTENFDASVMNECLLKLLEKANKVQGKLSCVVDKKHDNISNKYDLTTNNNANNVLQVDRDDVESNVKFLTNEQYEKNEQLKSASIDSTNYHQALETLLDLKISQMEQRLSRKIDLLEARTNEKLDKIIKSLDFLKNFTVEQ
ncbi:GSCOCG00008599001-RA-CDS [Cotesia congregata]|uniref:Uncharacterized protein n=1 Tax=Cotesia congregata TaxID=51543 RepID=A0A8J2EK28_COTCN|nr:GSCOCG00008599001-RA-CDS [Cotesia congregata]CAG5075511.1 Protein of unknown function [Cotesia congregata]